MSARFASVAHGEHRFACAVETDHVVPLVGIRELGAATPISLLRNAPLRRDHAIGIEEVRFLPVVPHPQKVIGIGLNYRAHIEETGRDDSAYPVLFAKFASSLLGAFDPIVLPVESSQVDFEGELAIVIGEHVRRVPAEHALAAVAGYAVANDVTMRDFQYKTHQWLQGKAWEHSTPVGPSLVTVDELGDASSLDIELRLNDQSMQKANTSQLIFDVPTLVSFVSVFTSLAPGDIILTGTPGGVGYRRDPKVFLTDGDTVEVEISGVGRIESCVISEPPALHSFSVDRGAPRERDGG